MKMSQYIMVIITIIFEKKNQIRENEFLTKNASFQDISGYNIKLNIKEIFLDPGSHTGHSITTSNSRETLDFSDHILNV